MANIVILGAGVMGSALANVAAEGNSVTLVGSPLDDHVISALLNGDEHPGLNTQLSVLIKPLYSSALDSACLNDADVIVLGVSSPGVQWALGEISHHDAQPELLALVTKGLVASDDPAAPPVTYAQILNPTLTSIPGNIVGIGGPCIARELALGYPTCVSFAAFDIAVANRLRELFNADYYHISTTDDFTGLEACAALKNFMCIGVSAMIGAHKLDQSYAKNPVAGLFNQAVLEIRLLSDWIREAVTDNLEHNAKTTISRYQTAYDLAGMGDLHVTVGGGRNSRLGSYLGTGKTLGEVMGNEMAGVTVEGVDTGRQLLTAFRHACANGVLNGEQLPLSSAILDVIEHDKPFEFDFKSLAFG